MPNKTGVTEQKVFRFPHDTVRRLRLMAKETGRTQTDIVVSAVQQVIGWHEAGKSANGGQAGSSGPASPPDAMRDWDDPMKPEDSPLAKLRRLRGGGGS